MKVKNWAEFQHYKDRRPPWIKLHHELLDNYEFHCLPVASRAIAPMIWLLASESQNGSIEFDLERMSFRLHQPRNEILSAIKPLISKGFLELGQDDSAALAKAEQDAMPEERREEAYTQETEGEGKIKKTPSQADFDERDMRKFLKARTVINAKLSNGWGQNLTDEQLFIEQCLIAEVPPKKMREVLARQGETA